MRIALDKFLVLAFLAALFTLGLATNAPFFEQFGRGRLTYMTVWALPLVLLVVVIRRTSSKGILRFLSEWWPVVGVLAVYESLKHMHANRITEWLGITPKDELMLKIDEVLFFGKTLPLYMDSWTAPWFLRFMTFSYIWVYYAGPVILLAYAYLVHGESQAFRRLRLGIILGLLGGYVLYILVPVAGPLFLVGDQFTQPIPSQSKLENLVFDTLRYNWDCFPSLHTAIPWILTFLSWRFLSRPARGLCVVLASSVTLSTVALRFHYGIDLIAAFVWVAIVVRLVRALERRQYGQVRLPATVVPQSVAEAGASQWSVIAAGWSLYAVSLLVVSSSIVLATPILIGQKLAVLLFVLFMLAVELGLLVLLNGAVEALARRWNWPRHVDWLRGFVVAGLVTALIASLLKFGRTGTHLGWGDLLPGGEAGASLGMTATVGLLLLVVVLGLGVGRGLAVLRQRVASVDGSQLVKLTALLAVGAVLTYRSYPAARSFASHVLPEFSWLFGG